MSFFQGLLKDLYESSKHFIVFKGYRRTCMRAPNFSLFSRVIGGRV